MTTVAVIVNPIKVDDQDALRRAVHRRADPAAVLWLETTEDDPGAGMVAEALEAGARLILACGGDGTVAACAGAVAAADPQVALAVLPSGTGNLLARNLALPVEREAALDVAFGPGRRTVDVLDAGDRRYVVMAGLGFDAAMMRETDEELKGRIGWLAYTGGLVRALRTPHARFTVQIDTDPPIERDAVGVLVGNVGKLHAGAELFPDADPADGLLDVIVLAPRRRPADYLGLVWRLLRRTAADSPSADVLRGKAVTVRADRPVAAEFDGDLAGERSELSVQVLKAALTICVAGPGGPSGPGGLGDRSAG